MLIEKQKIELSHQSLEKIGEFFRKIGLPLLPEDDFRDRELTVAEFSKIGPTRNLIEHNNRRVNANYLQHVKDSGFQMGQQITIGMRELGRALAAIEFAGDNLNQRAIQRFGIGGQPIAAGNGDASP